MEKGRRHSLRPTVTTQTSANGGTAELWKDGKLTPGETFSKSYSSVNLRTWLHNQTDDKFADKEFFSPQHSIGSFGFSMRVNADGQTATVAVYDSKTISSFSDNFLDTNANTKNSSSSGRIPFSTQYIRFIWKIYLVN